jgi:flagellar hook-associated protein 1 FlgK
MPDILSTGVSGLRAFQRALDVTSHNIANATTPGYSRQSVQLGTRVAEGYGNSYIGSGVNINAVTRSYDQLLTTQMRTASSTFTHLAAYADKAQKLNNLFADSTTGLSASMQKFINSVQGVSNDPTSTAARQVMLGEAEGLKQRLQTYELRLDDVETEINAQMTSEAAAITSAATRIARLNEQIVASKGSGQAPNDLLDARDELISELSGHISVNVVPQDDGAWNVFVGNGQSLVLGSNSATFVTQPDSFDPTRMTMAFKAGSSTVDMSTSVTGGTLGGLMDFRREMLDPARNQLGQIAVAVATAANAQHREGMDLQGNLGGDLFRIGAVEVLPERGNTGAGTIGVTRTNIGAMSADDTIFEFNGTAWSARDAVTGNAVTMTGAGTVASPFVANGLSIVMGGAAAAGDRFLVKPTAGAIGGLAVAVTDPSRVAAAAPIRSSAASANTGSGVISAGEVLDAANPQLRTAVTIEFIDSTHYSVNGAGSVAFAPGDNIDINGWRVNLSGAPQAGDQFTITNNAGGVGDNRNALALADILGQGVLAGGTESINGAISRFVGNIGVSTSQAQSGADAQGIILEDVQASVESISGVNLDEEAANMLRYQQAYQAAAQVIRITQTLFDTLLGATRR